MSDWLIFAAIAALAFALFGGFVFWLVEGGKNDDATLRENVRSMLGFVEKMPGDSALWGKTHGVLLYDFALAKEAPQQLFEGRFGGRDTLLFQLTDYEGRFGGLKERYYPNWHGAVTASNDESHVELIVFRSGIARGPLAKYKQVPASWSELPLSEELQKRGYVLRTGSGERLKGSVAIREIETLFSRLLLELFGKEPQLVGGELALQVKDGVVALYGDQAGFRDMDELRSLLDAAVRIANRLERL